MRSTAHSWLGDDRSAVAANRILDVAAGLFVTHGVPAVNMNQIAREAGCSRATLYRYFPSRSDLHLAYVEREARALSTSISGRVAGVTDLHDRVTQAILAAVAGVRGNPVLRTWFVPESAALTGAIGTSSELVNRIAVAFIHGDTDGSDLTLQGRFMVRIILSLLMTPGADAAEERELVRRFVTPAVLSPPDVDRA